jgi:hypothetical protein
MNRRLIYRVVIAVASCLTCTIGSFADEPLPVGSAKQLFLDRRFIESSRGVQLVVNRPRVTGEKLLVPEKPWEDMALGGYTSVIQEGGRIHLWYLVMDLRGANDTSGRGNGLAYAFSTDGGAAWTRPSLGIVKYQGSTNNNLVMFFPCTTPPTTSPTELT